MRTKDGEGGGQEGQPVEHGQRDHDGPRQPQRPDVAEAEHDHAEKPDGHRDPGEENGAPRRRHGVGEGLGNRPPPDLLAKAVHDEQRVVDGDTQPDHGHDVRRIGRDGHVARKQLGPRDAADHRQHAHAQWEEGGHHRAEGQQEEDHDHGKDDELGPLEVALGDLDEVVVDGQHACPDHLESP